MVAHLGAVQERIRGLKAARAATEAGFERLEQAIVRKSLSGGAVKQVGLWGDSIRRSGRCYVFHDDSAANEGARVATTGRLL